jgi:hypothetical protein
MRTNLHHFGIVVKEIESYLEQSLWEIRGQVVTDPIQRCRLCMAAMPTDATVMIEIVEPLDDLSPAWRALQRGPTWHHICLGISTMQAADALIREKRLLPVTPWQPAVLFSGRAIRFVYTRNRELIEFLSDEVTS